jgi:hypothetical protein
VAIDGYLPFEHAAFVKKNIFPFLLATALLIGDVSTNFTLLIRFAYSRCENYSKAERTRLRQYIGGTIVYFLNRQGGSNLRIFWEVNIMSLIQKVN